MWIGGRARPSSTSSKTWRFIKVKSKLSFAFYPVVSTLLRLVTIKSVGLWILWYFLMNMRFYKNLTFDSLLISFFSTEFTWAGPKIVLNIKQNNFRFRSGKFRGKHKQSQVKFWLNVIKYGNVSYWLSCIQRSFFFWFLLLNTLA